MVADELVQHKFRRDFSGVDHVPECCKKCRFSGPRETKNRMILGAHGKTSIGVRTINRSNSLCNVRNGGAADM